VIQEVTEDENDDLQDLPPPPPPISEALEGFLTPVKNAENASLNISRGVLSDRKVRNVTQV
jgi:hypothetical protein